MKNDSYKMPTLMKSACQKDYTDSSKSLLKNFKLKGNYYNEYWYIPYLDSSSVKTCPVHSSFLCIVGTYSSIAKSSEDIFQPS
jgi:hypothetical protein